MCVRSVPLPPPPSLPLTPTPNLLTFTTFLCPCRSHHLRKLDRELNGISFPSLYFPELYLLHGGYKAMYTAVQAKEATPVSPTPTHL